MRTQRVLNKLRTMSAEEVGHRGRAKFREQVDRICVLLNKEGVPLFTVPEPYLTHDFLAAEPSRRFFPINSHLEIRGLVQREFPDWISRAIAHSERILEGKLEILGHGEIAISSPPDWRRDPVSGQQWPTRYWADYDLVRKPEAGDPKVIHEINRHQHLVTLGRAYVYTDDERYAETAIAQIDGWIDQNPPGVGINWNSSLEIAIRALSWTWALFLLLPSRNLDDLRIERILKALLSHFNHIYRYPSVYSSPNTHLIGEALALYVGGIVFSPIEQAGAWQRFGESTLVYEAQKQILDDGFYGELTSYYHCYALEFYLMALALARRMNTKFPPSILSRIEAMLDVLTVVARRDGSIPHLSDDDGGRALVLSDSGYRDVRSLLSTGAVLFQRPDFKFSAGRFYEETLWLLGKDSYDDFNRIKEQPPKEGSRLFPSAGYSVIGAGVESGRSQMIFDCGGLGFLGGGHGHADALSVVLTLDGKDLLVDPGTAVYNGAPEWRRYFRSTRAHNTVVVDGEDQAAQGGTFDWQTSISSRVTRRFVLENLEYIEAEHNGYARLTNPVVHRRRILHIHPNCWVIADDFRGQGPHCFESFFHFAPQAELNLDARKSLTGLTLRASSEPQEMCMGFYSSSAVHSDVIRGAKNPVQGWYSRDYGDVQSAPVLCLTVHDNVPSAQMSVLVPREVGSRKGKLPEFREELVGGSGVACTLLVEGARDFFLSSLQEEPIRVGEFSFTGEFLWVRSVGRRVREMLCINASHVAYQDQVLFENPTPVSCADVKITADRFTTIYGDMERNIYVRN